MHKDQHGMANACAISCKYIFYLNMPLVYQCHITINLRHPFFDYMVLFNNNFMTIKEWNNKKKNHIFFLTKKKSYISIAIDVEVKYF